MSQCAEFQHALKELNAYRNNLQHEPDGVGKASTAADTALYLAFQRHLLPISSQIDCYVVKLESSYSILEEDERRALCRDTRLALRLAASFVVTVAESSPHVPSGEVKTHPLLTEAAQLWAKSILQILACHEGDTKCRLYAARLYCNIISSDSSGTLAQSYPHIERNISLSLASDHILYSWLDFIQSALGQLGDAVDSRACLAAILAALYNAIMTQERQRQKHDCEYGAQSLLWLIKELSSSRILLRTLLHELKLDNTASTLMVDICDDDDTNEWILLLIERLVESGLLPDIYTSLDDDISEEMAPTPVLQRHACQEQNVLLACLRKSQVKVFGRNDRESQACLLFLAEQYCRITEFLRNRRMTGDEGSNSEQTVEIEDSAAVACKLVDLLAESLGTESLEMAHLRLHLGHSTPLIAMAGRQLARLVDELQCRNSSSNSQPRPSSKLTMSVDEQQSITSLVRLLGNLVYHCPPNQDLLRTTNVGLEGNVTNDVRAPRRNVIHILLSCTSFAWACFTLREWALVAIRNTLEGNEANQTLVADLQAQEAVQSASLTDMGIRVELDNAGKVSVKPLDNPN